MPLIIQLRPAPNAPLVVHPAAPPTADGEVDRVWLALRAANPRLHDGPILLIDADHRCTRSTYRTLATAAALGREVRSLGVQGVVIGRDAAGGEHLLFGRRNSETRIYGGLWENAPSGAVPPPPSHVTELREADFVAALRAEGVEELGVDLADSDIRWLAMLEDPEAMSDDVVLEVRVRGTIDPRRTLCTLADSGRWEYVDVAWVAMADVGEWAGRNERAISPPTLALLEFLTRLRPQRGAGMGVP